MRNVQWQRLELCAISDDLNSLISIRAAHLGSCRYDSSWNILLKEIHLRVASYWTDLSGFYALLRKGIHHVQHQPQENLISFLLPSDSIGTPIQKVSTALSNPQTYGYVISSIWFFHCVVSVSCIMASINLSCSYRVMYRLCRIDFVSEKTISNFDENAVVLHVMMLLFQRSLQFLHRLIILFPSYVVSVFRWAHPIHSSVRVSQDLASVRSESMHDINGFSWFSTSKLYLTAFSHSQLWLFHPVWKVSNDYLRWDKASLEPLPFSPQSRPVCSLSTLHPSWQMHLCF